MRPPLRLLRRAALTLALLPLTCLVAVPPAPASAAADTAKSACVYTNHSISELDAFGTMVGRPMTCAMVYNDAVSTWQQWDSPWFIDDHIADNDWSAWATAAGTTRQLVITQDLIPSDLDGDDWLDAGASGAYTPYATTLAQNLVDAGLGGAIIRLAPEANGTWFADSLGTTTAQWALWDQFWDRTVEAMRAVPGAHFQFDWCISAGYRALPLSEIYPGSQEVDIIGVDVYDDGNLGSTGAARWSTFMNEAGGLGAVVDFAAAQDKPISIPEWGVNTVAGGGFGDDPAFVEGIANLVENHPTAYQSYFYKYGQLTQLAPGTQSLAAYQAAFGADGYALGAGATPSAASTGSTSEPTTAAAPATSAPVTTSPPVTTPAPVTSGVTSTAAVAPVSSGPTTTATRSARRSASRRRRAARRRAARRAAARRTRLRRARVRRRHGRRRTRRA